LKTELQLYNTTYVNTRPSPCHLTPLIHLRHMALYKCVLTD